MGLAITRRRMLLLVAALGGAAGLARFARIPPFDDRTGGSLAAHFDRPDSARRIGEAYLARYPQEADAALLKDQIAGPARGAGDELEAKSSDELSGWVRDRVRDDFLQGRTVVLDGWVLSSTEARLCALLYLE